jgi:uncharacterized protein
MSEDTKFNSAAAETTATPKAATDPHEKLARTLIREQRTMVLGTCSGQAPWTAPVYYVHLESGFYFFSSPNARHIAESPGAASAAIFADSERWEQIQGLQMSGTIRQVSRTAEKLKAVAHFLLKFPFARPFLQAEGSKEDQPHVGDRVQIYVFVPQQAYYLNNRLGFGKRVPVTLIS